jgi:predicted RND superfamily exporter protein
MAIAVIVGIIFATFLTLIVVPVMYSLVDDATAPSARELDSLPGGDGSPRGPAGNGKEAGREGRVPSPEPVGSAR